MLALQGYIYDGPAGRIGFKPVLNPEDHASFFTTAEGYGLYKQKQDGDRLRATIKLSEGQATIREVVLNPSQNKKPKSVRVTLDGKAMRATLKPQGAETLIRFESAIEITAGQTLAIDFS